MKRWFLLVLMFAAALPVYAHEEETEKMELVLVNAGEGEALSVGGDKVIIKTDGSQTEGEFALMEYFVSPGGGPPAHVHHYEEESFYILEGQFEFTLDGETVKAGPGTFLKSPADIAHSLKNTGTETGRMLVLVTPSGLEDYFRKVGHKLPDISAPVPAFGPEDAAKLTAFAPQFGLEFIPPAAETESLPAEKKA